MSKKILTAQIVLVLIVAALFVAYLRSPRSGSVNMVVAPPIKASAVLPGSASDFPLVNPSVTADVSKHYIINFQPLKASFLGLQSKYPGKAYVYFIYLNNAAWVGINEKDLFTAASTIKVPLAMSIYKMAEEGKLKTSDNYSLTDLDLDANFGNLYKAGADNAFMIEELVGIMLQHSDNTAMHALFHVMDMIGITDPLADLYAAMGWDYTSLGESPSYVDINLKTLSNMFLALYNAQYDSIDDSQRILNYLSQTDFTDQIPAGVPSTVTVAHKIGVALDDTYSDCGIVYAPNRPYILCMGTHGMPELQSDQFMKEVSKAAYQYVINN